VAGKTTGKLAAAGKQTAKKMPASTATDTTDDINASTLIDNMIAKLGDWRGELLAEIRRLIHEADPNVVEEWKWKGSPVWSHNGMYINANGFKDKVKITFHHGAQLADPKKLFNNGLDGNKWRAIDLYEKDKLNKTAFKALVREAVLYNNTHSVPKSKGSTSIKTPVLLSGGNPQIAKGDGDAPVQQYLAAMPGWKAGVGRMLDTLITQSVPDVRKSVRWNSPMYSVTETGWFISFHCFTKYVRITFFAGASLDPQPLGKSKYQEVRYHDIYENAAVDNAQLTSWIKQAAKLPGWKM